MIDWGAVVVGPVNAVFGQPVHYWPSNASPLYRPDGLAINGIFNEAYRPAGQLADLGVMTVYPMLAVDLAQFPAAFDVQQVQGDRFAVLGTGKTYVVKAGHLDGHGRALLEAMAGP